MKILVVHDHFGAFGGAEANIILTASELSRRGHTLGILHGAATGKSETAWNEVFQYRLALPKVLPADSVRTALQVFKPDLIYVQKMADLAVLKAIVESAVPRVRMVHDHDLYCMKSSKYSFMSRRPCGRAFSPACIFPCGAVVARNRAGLLPIRWVSYLKKKKEIALNKKFHRLIVYSDHSRNELIKNGFAPNKIEVRVTVREGNDSKRHSSFSGRNLILFAGQIIRGKGVDLLLKALSRVSAPFECAILGDGSHRAACEKLGEKLRLNDRVRFHGYVTPEHSEEFYLNASLFVVSSVWPEPFGMTGPEAMRYGLPVVAFDVGGISEWLINGHNGFLVPWMDCDAMAVRIQELLTNKILARQLGENGFQFVNRHYDLARYVDGIEKTFEQVIAENQIPSVRNGSAFHAHSTWKFPIVANISKKIPI